MNQSNDQHLTETLSALMDGESDDLELRRLLKQLPDSTQQAEILDTWRRFHLARSALHGEPVRASGDGAAQRIIAAIADEPVYSGAAKTGAGAAARHRGQLIARLAIAASVAVAVFLGMQTALSPDSGAPGMASAPVTSERDDRASYQPGTEVTSSFDADAQRRLNEYIQNVSIQQGAALPQSSIFEEIPLLRQVNQIEMDSSSATPAGQGNR